MKTVAVLLLLACGAFAQTYKTLYTFTNWADGGIPSGTLLADAAGNLYGTTNGGGDLNCEPPRGCGTVFEMTPQAGGGWNHSILYAFTGPGWIKDQASSRIDPIGDASTAPRNTAALIVAVSFSG